MVDHKEYKCEGELNWKQCKQCGENLPLLPEYYYHNGSCYYSNCIKCCSIISKANAIRRKYGQTARDKFMFEQFGNKTNKVKHEPYKILDTP